MEILNGTSFIAMRSIASKLVPADELGNVFKLLLFKKYTAIFAEKTGRSPGECILRMRTIRCIKLRFDTE